MNTENTCIHLGNVHVIAVSYPEINKEISRKQDAIFASRPMSMSMEMTTRGYLTTAIVPSREHWKKMRRILTTEVFSLVKHRWFYAKMIEEADHLVHYVYNQIILGGLLNVRMATQHYYGEFDKENGV
ncbi:hypothetical protein QYF36_019781 [Acer negundo]|nr:hypothetical protein QYF36_019781 [Acer negundo]